MKVFQTILREKVTETGKAVLPVIGIVLILCFSIAPISPGILMAFLVGAVFLMVGMILFSLGVEMSMTPMGERVGTCMTKTRKLWIMILMGFVLGFVITVSEPDLQVLAEQVPSVPNLILIIAVAVGVGIFLVVALLRMLFGIALPPMLVVFIWWCSHWLSLCRTAFSPWRLIPAVLRRADDGSVHHGAGRRYRGHT